jgi:hypothetical protein
MFGVQKEKQTMQTIVLVAVVQNKSQGEILGMMIGIAIVAGLVFLAKRYDDRRKPKK